MERQSRNTWRWIQLGALGALSSLPLGCRGNGDGKGLFGNQQIAPPPTGAVGSAGAANSYYPGPSGTGAPFAPPQSTALPVDSGNWRSSATRASFLDPVSDNQRPAEVAGLAGAAGHGIPTTAAGPAAPVGMPPTSLHEPGVFRPPAAAPGILPVAPAPPPAAPAPSAPVAAAPAAGVRQVSAVDVDFGGGVSNAGWQARSPDEAK